MKVLIVGTFGVGKSTFVKEIRNKFTTPSENIDVADPETICQINRTTQDIQDITFYYGGNEITMYDSPGMFDLLIDTFEKSCIHAERILKQVESFNAIILCISSNNFDIRDIDKSVVEIFKYFPKIWEKIIVVVTKTDMIDKDTSKIFFQKCRCDATMSNFPIYDKYDIDSLLTKITSDRIYQNEIKSQDLIDNAIIIPLIDDVKKEMEINNLYPDNYENDLYNSISCLTITLATLGLVMIFIGFIVAFLSTMTIFPIVSIVIGVSLLFLFLLSFWYNINHRYYEYKMYFNKYYEKNYHITNGNFIKLSKIHRKIPNTQIKRVVIKYDNDKTFYEGTMFGNVFERGMFYYPNGDFMYVKNL